MIRIFRTINGKVEQIENYEKNCWICMTNPDDQEIENISKQFSIEEDYLRAALDRQETSRVEDDDDYNCSLITINVPCKAPEEAEYNKKTKKKKLKNIDLSYETLPVGIIETPFCVVTVCLDQISELEDFIEGKVKHVFTNLKTRFILQILYRISTSFVSYLKRINKKSNEVERLLHESLDNQQLYDMLDLEKSLVFFSTAIKSNQLVMDKLERGRILKLYEEDVELLEDIIIENDQANTMCSIYSNILSGTMDAFASIISNNLNIVMKVLTAITILMAIPTMVASYYGMNVEMLPFPNFWIVLGFSSVITLISSFVLYKFNMFS